MKHHFPKGILIALIVLLCMGTAVAAGGLLGGTMNWQGKVGWGNGLPYYEKLETEAEKAASQKLTDWVNLLEQDGELVEVTVRTADGHYRNTATGLRRTVSDIPGFEALMANVQSIPTPHDIPAGYELVRGVVEYGCLAEGEWRLLEDMTLEAGITAQRYILDEEDKYVHGYYLLFRAPEVDEGVLLISVEMKVLSDETNQDIVFSEGQKACVVNVPGVDNAVLLSSANEHHLTMRQRLREPVFALDFRCGPEEYDEVRIDVIASALDVDTLIRMFAAE